MSIDLDLTPFFELLNDHLPTFLAIFGLLGVIGGIAAVIAFGLYIIRQIVDELSGRRLRM